MKTNSHLASISLNPERPAYVPPHLRNAPRAPPAAAAAPAPVFNAPVASHPGSNGYHQSPTGLPTPAPTPAPLRSAYVPPSARGASGPADASGGWDAPRKPIERSFGGSANAPPGYGAWSASGHVIGARNTRMEKELYGEIGDGLHQVRLLFVSTEN